MKFKSPGLKASLIVYGGIVVMYVALMAWWAFFFSGIAPELTALVEGADDPAVALETWTHGKTRMFAFEGAFLGLLLLVSALFVVRAVRRERGLYRQQQNFLSAVTHELRSPLSSARLYLESIAMGRTDASKTERYLRHATEDLDRLGAMVEDLLDARRLSTERVELELENLDLRALADERAERFHVMHEHQGHSVKLDAPAPVMVEADREAVHKILDNLISNAIKYGGDATRVTVAVSLGDREGVLVVRDTGPGLQGADPQRIVHPFVRGGDENVRTQPGAGLGLHIVNELVQAHGGTLAVSDGHEGGGTRVRVTFPLAPLAPHVARTPPVLKPSQVERSQEARS